MIRSMPVAASSARMFRPSRPMIRALHLVVRKVHDGYRCLGHVIAGVPLDGQADDVLRLLVRLFLGLVLDPLDGLGRLELGFVLHRDHELALGLLGGHVGDLLEHLPLLAEPLLEPLFLLDGHLFSVRQLPFAADRLGLALLDDVHLLLEVLFLLGEPALLVLEFLPLLAVLLLELGPRLVQLVLGLEHGLLALGLRLALGVRHDPGRLCFCILDLACRDLSLDQQAKTQPAGKPDDQQYNVLDHCFSSWCLFFSPARRSLMRFSSPCSVGR